MRHVMVDLETLGTKPGSVILSIGAVEFDPDEQVLGKTFYTNIDVKSQKEIGLKIDPVAVEWWKGQSKEAIDALKDNQVPIQQALADFNNWFKANKAKYVWAHGASFDPVLMESAYDACGIKAPWTFYDLRCCRTVLELSGIKKNAKYGTAHNSLEDSKAQAHAVMIALNA